MLCNNNGTELPEATVASVGEGWRFGLAVMFWSRSTSYSMPGPFNTSTGDHSSDMCTRTAISFNLT